MSEPDPSTSQASPPTDSSADAIGAAIASDELTGANDWSAVLSTARDIGEQVLLPNAQIADRANGPRPENFKALANAGLLGISLPRAFGGMEAPASVQRRYTEILASACGVTTFVQAQHHGSSRMIAAGPSDRLKRAVVPELAAGRMLCAISFAHLRRPGPPVLAAVPDGDGYRLNGKAPWVTGWGLMRQVVFGATLPDGRFLYVWSPGKRSEFADQFGRPDPDASDWGSLTASAPIPLCAMNASSTVELTLQNWYIPGEHRLQESDRETMQRNDRAGVLGPTAMPLGCAAAGLRVLKETAEKKPLPAISKAAEAFSQEIAEARYEVENWSARAGESEFFENGLRVRAWCIDLAMRTAYAAIASVSGSANSLDHPAQRLLREAMFYTIQAQTREVMEATLQRLER